MNNYFHSIFFWRISTCLTNIYYKARKPLKQKVSFPTFKELEKKNRGTETREHASDKSVTNSDLWNLGLSLPCFSSLCRKRNEDRNNAVQIEWILNTQSKTNRGRISIAVIPHHVSLRGA